MHLSKKNSAVGIVANVKKLILKNKQEIDHKWRACRNLGQGQRSCGATGCGLFRMRSKSLGELKQKWECVPGPEFESFHEISVSNKPDKLAINVTLLREVAGSASCCRL